MLPALNTRPWTRLSPRKHRGYRPVVRRVPRGRTHLNYFRDYDPQTGRYLESDPLGLAAGQVSTYAYAASQPTSFADPAGKNAVAIGIGVGAGVLVVGCELSPSCAQGLSNEITNYLNQQLVIDPDKPIPPQLPGYIDPKSLIATTQASSCPPMKDPRSPKDLCLNAVALKYEACRRSGMHMAYCELQRVFLILFCTAKSPDSFDDFSHH